jgi:hypothetical protein
VGDAKDLSAYLLPKLFWEQSTNAPALPANQTRPHTGLKIAQQTELMNKETNKKNILC